MPFEIRLSGPISGVLADSVQEGGEQAYLIVREFSSTENGEHFINRLENLATIFYDLIPGDRKPLPSTIDHMLAVIRRDNTATLYVNELRPLTKGLLKRKVEPGPIHLLDDIAAIQRVEFDGVQIPDDAGVVYLFSIGWRKGIFFDLEPMNGEGPGRQFDLAGMLAWCLDRLRLQALWSLSEADWEKLLAARWFPFVALRYERAKDLIEHVRKGFDLAFLTNLINADFTASLPERLEAWRSNEFFQGHIEALERAVERHQSGDYFSSTTILYLRIEGIMKAYHLRVDDANRYGQKAISASATRNLNHPQNVQESLLAPAFTRFLQEVYYGRNEKSQYQAEEVCRNSVSHGTADYDGHSLKTSLLGLLIVDQLFYYLKPGALTSTGAAAQGPPVEGDPTSVSNTE